MARYYALCRSIYSANLCFANRLQAKTGKRSHGAAMHQEKPNGKRKAARQLDNFTAARKPDRRPTDVYGV